MPTTVIQLLSVIHDIMLCTTIHHHPLSWPDTRQVNQDTANNQALFPSLLNRKLQACIYQESALTTEISI